MGLRDEITADIAEAFDNDLADAVSEFTGSRIVSQGTFDPVTETWSDPVTESYTGRGVFGSFDMRVVDGVQILRTDVKLTALQAEVTGTPKIDDTINEMKVIHAGKDPADVTWILQLRRV